MQWFSTERLRLKLWGLFIVALVLCAMVVVWAPVSQYIKYGPVPLPDELVKITGTYRGKVETRIWDPKKGSIHTGYYLNEDSILYIFALWQKSWLEMSEIDEGDTVKFIGSRESDQKDDGEVFRYLYGVREGRKVIIDAEATIRDAQARYYPSGWMWITSIIFSLILYLMYHGIKADRADDRRRRSLRRTGTD